MWHYFIGSLRRNRITYFALFAKGEVCSFLTSFKGVVSLCDKKNLTFVSFHIEFIKLVE